MKTIENQYLYVQISERGAELQSICEKSTAREYLWQGDAQYWHGRSPLLFPNVGNLWNKQYRIDKQPFTLPKHGFAKDKDFTIRDEKADSITFVLCDDADTRQVYPYQFELRVTYQLDGQKLSVKWDVFNRNTSPMYFQIGGHPALNYVDFCEEDAVHGYLSFDKTDSLQTRLIGEQGCAAETFAPVPLDNEKMLPLTNTTFNIDTFVLQNSQVHAVTLHDKHRTPYARVRFNTAVLCLWSPCAGNAPFVCIEPWAGLCDTVGFAGDISERNFINCADTHFSTAYEMEFLA